MRIVCTPQLRREELTSAGTSGRDEVVSGFNLFQLCSRGYQVSCKVVPRAFPPLSSHLEQQNMLSETSAL